MIFCAEQAHQVGARENASAPAPPPPSHPPRRLCRHGRRGKTNFFEKRVGEYQKNGVMAGLNKDSSSHGFSMDNDF